MMYAKYIMTSIGPIIFPANCEHRHFKLHHPTSAGHVIIHNGEVTTYGESISLQMKSHKSDAEKIAFAFGIERTSE